jgi:hypothetical protein
MGDSIILYVDYNTAGSWDNFASVTCNVFASAGTLDIGGLDRIDSIRIRADLETKGDNLPDLYDWAVSWVPFPLSINDNNNNPDKMNILITPNPFNSSLCISAPNNSEIAIFDINGKKIETLKSTSNTLYWRPSAQVSSGVYLLKIKSDEKNSVLQKVVYLK